MSPNGEAYSGAAGHVDITIGGHSFSYDADMLGGTSRFNPGNGVNAWSEELAEYSIGHFLQMDVGSASNFYGSVDPLHPFSYTLQAADYDNDFTAGDLEWGSASIGLRDRMVSETVSGAVPEPASWAMMVGGFGLAGAAMRRRKARVAFA